MWNRIKANLRHTLCRIVGHRWGPPRKFPLVRYRDRLEFAYAVVCSRCGGYTAIYGSAPMNASTRDIQAAYEQARLKLSARLLGPKGPAPERFLRGWFF